MILVDTSVWIELFRKNSSLRPEAAFDLEEVVTCLPVIQEVLQGFGDEGAFRKARQAMLSLPIVESPLGTEVYEQGIELYRLARRQGLTVRSSADCLIAACALRHDLTVIHRDRDYPALAKVSSLRERRI
jgi:predicted nucleic acid-binding protein